MMRTKSRFVTILLVFLCLAFPIAGQVGTALAQAIAKVPGSVVGIDGKPLMGVDVRLIDISTGKVVDSTKTAKDGSFEFYVIKTGIAYKTYKVEASHENDSDSDLVTVWGGASKPAALKLSWTKGLMVFTGNLNGSNPGNSGENGNNGEKEEEDKGLAIPVVPLLIYLGVASGGAGAAILALWLSGEAFDGGERHHFTSDYRPVHNPPE